MTPPDDRTTSEHGRLNYPRVYLSDEDSRGKFSSSMLLDRDEITGSVDGVQSDKLSDLNKYCQALIDMLAESVPDVQKYLHEATDEEF